MMYYNHAHCTHEPTTEARRQCRRMQTVSETELTVPGLDLEAALRLKRLGGAWRDAYEMLSPGGEVVGVLTRVDYLQEVKTRRGIRNDRVTEYRMGFRRRLDPARRFEGQGSKKIHDALEMATRAYLELTV